MYESRSKEKKYTFSREMRQLCAGITLLLYIKIIDIYLGVVKKGIVGDNVRLYIPQLWRSYDFVMQGCS